MSTSTPAVAHIMALSNEGHEFLGDFSSNDARWRNRYLMITLVMNQPCKTGREVQEIICKKLEYGIGKQMPVVAIVTTSADRPEDRFKEFEDMLVKSGWDRYGSFFIKE